MTKVHFCWCGTYPDDDNEWKVLETPTAVSKNLNAQVYYWGSGECLNQIRQKMGANGAGVVKYRDLTLKNHVLGTCTEKDMPWIEDYLEAVRYLIREKLFIMVKDLLSLICLQRSGGFFMDTTMKVPDDTNVFKDKFKVPKSLTPHSLNHALKSPPSGLMVPIVHNDAGLSIIGMSEDMTLMSLTEGGQGRRDVPEIEVWCMYAPERDKRGKGTAKNITMALDEAIERYLKRLKLLRAGLGKNDKRLQGVLKTEDDRTEFHQIVTDVMARGRAYKPYVGAQVTSAIYDALFAMGFIGRNEQFTPQTKLPSWAWGAWPPKVPPKNAAQPFSLPKVGMIKRYGGSWY